MTVGEATQDARALIDFAAGAEEAGLVDYARRARRVAWTLLWALDELAAERSARRAVEGDRDRCRDQRWREEHGEAWPE